MYNATHFSPPLHLTPPRTFTFALQSFFLFPLPLLHLAHLVLPPPLSPTPSPPCPFLHHPDLFLHPATPSTPCLSTTATTSFGFFFLVFRLGNTNL
ncbi:MAG: hypothetical protein J3Q66DRAFT_333002 [Benniella sp.]|nr:MAG: hypothetical protein J3Q66DRAFT_333002 [Benniella sp.]